MVKSCGFIFLFLLYSLSVFAEQPHTLEKIEVFKSSSLSNKYCIESEDLRDSSIRSISEAIGLLGIDTQARVLNYGVQTDFSLRGLGFEGLSILLNGQRINDPQTGHHNSDIPLSLEDIETIELDPFQATLNIIPKSAKDSENSFENSYGQYQTYASRLIISNKMDRPGLKLSLERRESRGFRDDTDFKTLITNLYSNFKFSPEQEAALFLGYNEKEFGAYDFYTPHSGYPSREWTKTLILDSRFNLKLEDLSFKPRFLWRRHFDKFMLDTSGLKSDYLNHHRTDLFAAGVSVKRQGELLDSLCLDLGFEEERINSTRMGRHGRSHYSISTNMQKQLTAQMIVDSNFVFDYFANFKDRLGGSIRLGYSLDQYQQFDLGISFIRRRPTFTENYYQDPQTRGNPNLSPEELLTYQLGYGYQQAGLNMGLTAFFRQEDNLINWVKKNPADFWQARNMLEADCIGMETHFEKRINPLLRGGFNYAYIDKRLKDIGWLYKYGSNYAAHLFNSFLELDLPLFFLSVELQYKKRPHRNGWALLNLSVRRDINKNFQIFCKISNVLNVEYQDLEGIPSPGRWAEAGMRIEW
ncbi:MAG: TonB-dependent receptor [Candidatus Omnitrophota bacterium]|jgi:iron complex outermembrane receptor protein